MLAFDRLGHAVEIATTSRRTPNAGNQGAIVIEDPHGNMITMTDWGITIHAAGTLNITAGGAINILGRPVRSIGGPI